MKITAKISLLALLVLGSTFPGVAQEKKCQFNIVGTWKAQISPTETRLYTFDDKGVLKVMNVSGTDKPSEIATAKYELLEDPKAPEEISLTAAGKTLIFGKTTIAMKVV